MRLSPENKAAARSSLVVSAGRRFRETGMAGIGIDQLAAASGQTSGAVYAHFKSKTDLFEAVVEEGMDRLIQGIANVRHAGTPGRWAAQFAERYLSREHRDAVAEGCILPSLSADIGRSRPALRSLYARRLDAAAELLAEGCDGESGAAKKQALALLALVAGGVLLSRAVPDDAAEAVLAGARQAAKALLGSELV